MIRSRLKVILAERELAQQEPFAIRDLAAASGVSRQTLYNLSNNVTTRYDGPVLDALCRVLGIPVGELLEYVPESPDASKSDRHLNRPVLPNVLD